MSHSHSQNEINKPEGNVHPPASCSADHPALYHQHSQPVHHWLAPNHEITVVGGNRENVTLLPVIFFPCCFQFYMQQWWEMNLPWVALKGSAKQRSIKKSMTCYRARVRHSPPCYNTAVAALISMLSWLWIINLCFNSKITGGRLLFTMMLSNSLKSY